MGASRSNYLWYTPFGQPQQLITRGGAGAGAAAGRVTRVPPGHPGGYLEVSPTSTPKQPRAICAVRKKGGKVPKDVIYPTVQDGVAGVAAGRGLCEVFEEERGLDETIGLVSRSSASEF